MAQPNWVRIEDLADSQLTPMLRQYIQAKAESGDSILFFRMGDFFEMFFEDALEAAHILGLALTSRDGADKDLRIPMAGVPVRSVDSYIARLIEAGRTVAICDQVEDPKAAKGIVKREVVRTVTPGTVLESELLPERSNNYLAALTAGANGRAGLALADISTGEFLAAQIDREGGQTLRDELARMDPSEVLAPDNLDPKLLDDLKRHLPDPVYRSVAGDKFDRDAAVKTIQQHFGLATLKGLGLEDAPEALACAGALLDYVAATQRDVVPHLRPPRCYSPSGYVVLDSNTQRNLELVESLAEKSRQGTLLQVLDHTRTHMGARKLRQWIVQPLLELDEIRARHGAVEDLYAKTELRLRLQEALKRIADIERLLGRLTSHSGNARDMLALGQSLAVVPELKRLVHGAESKLIQALNTRMDALADVTSLLDAAIGDDPPVSIHEGNMFRDGYHAELDRLRDLVRGGREWIATLQKEESQKTGIPKIKVGYNKVFGYYLEITKANVHLVPEYYQRKQTLVNAERYITPELKQREEDIVNANEHMQKLEYELFVELRGRIAAEAQRVLETADAIAALDALGAFAEAAVTKGYTKPEVNDSGDIVIRDGRHPVVEHLMRASEFVPNDVVLEAENGWLVIVTGPNMAGKSTYLRQVALITLMAQIGSFVPAASAHIGVVDRIFTRVGASDNLVRGESTFMVEMIETASILNTATDRSLLILDEIGRGTSTFDGISIAWAVAEFIHNHVRAKTVFATHYHELTELANQLEHAKNVNVAVREWGGKVIFLYRIVEGGADHSYGIQVAKLAGLPPNVIGRAREVLQELESGNAAALGIPEQMYLFGPSRQAQPSPLEDALEKVDPDSLNPREAHEFLYHLKSLMREKKADGEASD